jgi:hypothetical protein
MAKAPSRAEDGMIGIPDLLSFFAEKARRQRKAARDRRHQFFDDLAVLGSARLQVAAPSNRQVSRFLDQLASAGLHYRGGLVHDRAEFGQIKGGPFFYMDTSHWPNGNIVVLHKEEEAGYSANQLSFSSNTLMATINQVIKSLKPPVYISARPSRKKMSFR